MKTRISSIAATLLTVLLAGCVAQPVQPTPTSIASQVKPGDRIRLVTVSGAEEKYRVVRLDNDALYVKVIGHEGPGIPSSGSPTGISASSASRGRPQRMAHPWGSRWRTIVLGAALFGAMEYAGAAAACC